jgi:radical SAM superfamily enzyme
MKDREVKQRKIKILCELIIGFAPQMLEMPMSSPAIEFLKQMQIERIKLQQMFPPFRFFEMLHLQKVSAQQKVFKNFH